MPDLRAERAERAESAEEGEEKEEEDRKADYEFLYGFTRRCGTGYL